MKTFLQSHERTALLTVVVVIAAVTFVFKTSYFGLDHCSTVKDSIRSEESIGKLLWADYENNWSKHEANSGDSELFNPVVNSLIDVFQSDKRIYDLADKNRQCFTPSKNAWVRTEATNTALVIRNLKTWINSGRIFSQDFYPGYSSFFDISASTPQHTFKGTQV
jgi:hypothetical protein